MELQHYKAALATIWVLAACTMGIAVGVASLPALALLAVVGLLPPLIMLRLWADPPQSLAETIQEARR